MSQWPFRDHRKPNILQGERGSSGHVVEPMHTALAAKGHGDTFPAQGPSHAVPIGMDLDHCLTPANEVTVAAWKRMRKWIRLSFMPNAIGCLGRSMHHQGPRRGAAVLDVGGRVNRVRGGSRDMVSCVGSIHARYMCR